MNMIYRRDYPISAIHTDCFGRTKPSVLLYFAQEIAAEHCLQLGADWDTLKKKNLFWALVRTKVKISKLPAAGQTLTVETWPMPQTRIAYPRCTVAYDEQGNECFRNISIWVLMDSQSRNMVLPDKANLEVPGILRGTEPEAPRALPVFCDGESLYRTVGFAELDKNRHMNNTKYLDWVMDLCPASFHRDNIAEEITLCYLAEAREQDRLNLIYNLDETGNLTADGRRMQTNVSEKGERIFAAKVKFQQCSVNR